MAGIVATTFVEQDLACQKTIKSNRPNAVLFDNVFSQDLLSYAKKLCPDVVVGGPPCQSFSTIGRRKFLDDERGQTILGFIEVVETSLPKFFVLENVQGIVSANNGKIIKGIQKRFEQSGYTVVWKILNAANFGVPQIRKRFVMIGFKGGSFTFPEGDDTINILRDCIADLEEFPGEYMEFPNSIGSVMPNIPEGGCWKSLPKSEQNKVMGNATRSSGGLTAFYRRLDYGKPSPTLLTSPVQRATTLCHPRKNRPLSINEYKRIQCFPDNWKIEGTLRDKYKQLGNAVPVLLGKAIGKAIVCASRITTKF